MKFSLLSGVSAAALGFAGMPVTAQAGNILLTGHDNDFHCFEAGNAGNACGALGVEASYVRNGSSLPVLVIDDGSELGGSLGIEKVPYVAVTVGKVTAGMFNHSTYSAFAVASVTACGGCDNPAGTGTKLAAFSTAINSFVTAGGGLLGLTSSTDPTGFAYVPDAAGTPTAIGTSSGFVATSTGTAGVSGFFAVNGDETHNQFANPGTAGVSPLYKVAERFGGTTSSDPAITLFATGASVTTGGGITTKPGTVPEPVSVSLLGAGLFGLAAARRRAKAPA